MDCSKCHHDVNNIWSSKVMVGRGARLLGLPGLAVINVHERDGHGDSEPGQGQAAGLCSLAKRTLDAAEGRYAQSWLVVRHSAPPAMVTGYGFLPRDRLTPSTCVNIRTSKTVALLKTAKNKAKLTPLVL